MKTHLFSLSFLILLFSCKTAKQPAETVSAPSQTENIPLQTSGDSLFAYMERTPCYGQCPVYKFSIFNSGYAFYEGRHFVEMKGKYATHIDKQTLSEILQRAKTIHYSELRDDYPKMASDFPSVITSVVIDGKRKDVHNGSGAPQSLRQFELFLDSVKNNAVWKKLE